MVGELSADSRLDSSSECEWFGDLTYRSSNGVEKRSPGIAVDVMNFGESVTEPVGGGSQGTIYKQGKFAVKVLRRPHGAKLLENFRREAHILARLDLPSACRLRAVGVALGSPCIVLDWVESDLAREMANRWPNAARLRIAADLASALEHLHAGRAIGDGLAIIHRDVKPGNLGITASGQLKLLDFGNAAVVPRTSGKAWQLTGGAGSARYMAPEVALRAFRYGVEVDVYSFALTVWEFLGLKGVPFPNFTYADHIAYVARDGRRPKIPKSWHPRLAALVQASWAPQPAARPTAAALTKSLKDLIEDPNVGDPLLTPSYFPPWRRRRRPSK
ncbi:hypothetical protein CTAYLR_009588 [Chrysophaeum taylorii]|uniref:Protein kinase domain-containing protein n=1 Tax=Chrysophaeum taylorii TaxID=2483200 RepID=A0AAD7XIR6_9STRA|nr:hypothetical protein CTAYLR_009588 [Chrysophaeum taylorii]